MRAMILCAGLGVRLRPLTDNLPKPLVPLFDCSIVEYHLESLAEAGVEAAVVNLHHKPEVIQAHLGGHCRGMDIFYSHEPELLGPTGGIRKALPMLGDGPVIVVNGDIVMDIDFRDMISFHQKESAALTIAVGRGETRPDLRAVGVDPEQRVRQLWGKPAWEASPITGFVNLGAFVYEKRVIEEYIPDNSFYHFREGFIPRMFERGEKIMAYISDTYWNDIGSVGTYIQAHLDVFAGGGTERCRKRAADGAPDLLSGFIPPVFDGGVALIGDEVSIGPNLALGRECEIGSGSVLSNGVVLPGARVPEGTKADRFIAVGGHIIFPDKPNK
jgi:mannose-1-phosphate guanylyltransferase